MLAVSGKTWRGFFSDKSTRQRSSTRTLAEMSAQELTANEVNGNSACLCSRDDLVDAYIFTQVVREKRVSRSGKSQKRIEVGKLKSKSAMAPSVSRYVHQKDR